MKIRPFAAQDIPAIIEIYNQAVLKTTAIWNEATVDQENRRAWVQAHVDKGYPLLVAVNEQA